MIVNECNRLLGRIEALGKQRGDIEAADEFRQICDVLKRNSQLLTGPMKTLALFGKQGILVPSLPSQQASALHTFFSSTSVEYKNDGDYVRKRSFVLISRIEELKELGSKLASGLREAWQGYISYSTKDIDMRYLEVLAALGRFRHEIDRIRSGLLKVNGFASALPTTQEELDSLNEAVKELVADWESIVVEGLPDSVRGFLLAVRSEDGADVTMLDSEVRDWIASNGLQGVFGIVIRRSD